MEREPFCQECGNTVNLRVVGPNRWVCKWQGGCEHRQMRYEAKMHRLVAQIDAAHDVATFRKFLEEQGIEPNRAIAFGLFDGPPMGLLGEMSPMDLFRRLCDPKAFMREYMQMPWLDPPESF